MDVSSFLTFHTGGSLYGGMVIAWPLNVQNRSALRKQGGKLPGLKSSNLPMIPRHAEDGEAGGISQSIEVLNVAVQNHPADAGSDGSLCRTNQPRRRQRLEQNGIRARTRRRLNELQNLTTLGNSIVLGIENLYFGSHPVGGFPRGLGLFALVAVVIRKRDNKA